MNLKTDYRLGSQDTAFVRYTFYDVNAYQPYGYVAFASSPISLPGFGIFVQQRSQNVAVSENGPAFTRVKGAIGSLNAMALTAGRAVSTVKLSAPDGAGGWIYLLEATKGFAPGDDNEADALALLDWALKNGGRR